ncbi:MULTISPECIES: sensor histidine kinase [Flavobacteriaceae]|uniref:sensor histidine kinase n=1 Tax=Flavobacteriaceae TaxID=49546 RepID=UPI001FEBB09F|nr:MULTISPECIES: PAS domain-containing sensor histidine kinase [Allomuricauda]MDC6366960.1 PAS domain S-box protein [Muricauda sp. AC10]
MVPKSDLTLSRMADNQIEILKRALERQRKARFQAEKILEAKSKELYDLAKHLKQANTRLENLLDKKADDMDAAFLNIIDPYVVMDLNFNVLRTNHSAKEFLRFDYTKEAINLNDFVHPEFYQYTAESIQSLLEVGTLKNYRAKILLRDGTEKFVQINASLIYNREGKPIAAQGIIRDITQEKEVEGLLSEQRKQLDIIVENSPLGIVLMVQGKILKSNTAMQQMLGYTHDELKQISIKDITVKDDMAKSITYLNDMMKGKIDHFTFNKSYVRKDGSTFMAKTSVSAVRATGGGIEYQVGIVEDITEHKRLELQKEQLLKQLKSSNKELQEYAHIVSHDLKSPLRSISALATWLVEDYAKKLDENGVNQLQMIQEKIEGMDKLIDGILTYSGIDKKTDDVSEVDINEVISEIREIIFIPEHVNVVIMNTLPIMMAHKTKIHQLFQNLISNAVVHIEKKEGLVKICCEETKTHWQFNISDNGIGIPKEYHEKIFKVFQSLGTKERSTGIGLSIVKKIVDLYQGEIWLDSEKGKGTTFHFTLRKELV